MQLNCNAERLSETAAAALWAYAGGGKPLQLQLLNSCMLAMLGMTHQLMPDSTYKSSIDTAKLLCET